MKTLIANARHAGKRGLGWIRSGNAAANTALSKILPGIALQTVLAIGALVFLTYPGQKFDLWRARFGLGSEFLIWFEKYQTYMAGGLALLAAHHTILQMAKTDRLSEQRHSELIDLSLRRDRLMVDRAVNPLTDLLDDASEEVGTLKDSVSADLDTSMRYIFAHHVYLMNRMPGVAAMLSGNELRQARELFGGDMSHAMDRALSAASTASAALQEMWQEFDYSELVLDEATSVADSTKELVLKFIRSIETLDEHLTQFRGHLRMLEKTYLKSV